MFFLQIQPLVKFGVHILHNQINLHMGVSLNGGTPNLHPEMIIFSRKTHGFWGNPPFKETST